MGGKLDVFWLIKLESLVVVHLLCGVPAVASFSSICKMYCRCELRYYLISKLQLCVVEHYLTTSLRSLLSLSYENLHGFFVLKMWLLWRKFSASIELTKYKLNVKVDMYSKHEEFNDNYDARGAGQLATDCLLRWESRMSLWRDACSWHLGNWRRKGSSFYVLCFWYYFMINLNATEIVELPRCNHFQTMSTCYTRSTTTRSWYLYNEPCVCNTYYLH